MYEKKTDEEELETEKVCKEQSADFENLKGATVLADIQMSTPFEEEPLANVAPFEEASTECVTPFEIKDDLFKSNGNGVEMRLWGDILLKVKQSGDNILGAICETVDDTKINGQDFEIYMRSNAFDDIEEFNKMQKIVRETANLNLKICNRNKEKEKQSKDVEFLTQKFGKKLIII